MNKNEKKVLELVNIKKTMSIADICETLQFSESTARRTVSALSELKLINRYHGGAQSYAAIANQSSVQKRMDINPLLKDSIARMAASLIRSGQTVMLTGGTTVYMMCKYLMNRRITVITNSLIVFDELKNAVHLNDLILLGGRYNKDEMEVEGALTNFNLKLLKADCIFMGTNGFDPDSGFFTDRMEALELYRLCIEVSKEKYMLSDSSKLNGRGLAVIATCEMVDYFVTDPGLNKGISDRFLEKGIKVIFT